MRCYRKILHISYKDHVTNEEIRSKIQQAIGPHEDLLTKETQTTVVWPCLPFIRSGQSHLARHSKRGKKTRQTDEEVERQHQGMDRPGVHQVPVQVENREKWRKLVVKSSVVLQRPSGLRGRWWWWLWYAWDQSLSDRRMETARTWWHGNLLQLVAQPHFINIQTMK